MRQRQDQLRRRWTLFRRKTTLDAAPRRTAGGVGPELMVEVAGWCGPATPYPQCTRQVLGAAEWRSISFGRQAMSVEHSLRSIDSSTETPRRVAEIDLLKRIHADQPSGHMVGDPERTTWPGKSDDTQASDRHPACAPPEQVERCLSGASSSIRSNAFASARPAILPSTRVTAAHWRLPGEDHALPCKYQF